MINIPRNIPKPPTTIIANKIVPKDVQAVEIEEEESSVSVLERVMKKKPVVNSDDETIVMEDYFSLSRNNYDEFDKKARTKGNGYKIPSYPFVEAKLEGLEAGLYLFSGESNSGKSAAMMNMIKDICSYEENNLFGIYYSLDDTKHEIIPRIIAMEQSIPIGVASKPRRYEEMLEDAETCGDNYTIYQEYLEKRQIGLDKLKSEADKFLIEDANKIKTSTDIVNHIKMVKTFLKSFYSKQGDHEKAEKMNVIIAIDALNDIKLDPKVYGRIKKDEASEEVAKFVKDLSTQFDIVVFASSHLRKLNGNRRPTLDDLREANTLVYEASVVWLVYNDVSKNKQGAKIYWNDNQQPGPILEMDWAKNKKSSFKGRTFNKFSPNLSQIKECSLKEMEAFENKIMQE
jgi:replicative DNA helicase